VYTSVSDALVLADLNESLGSGFTLWPEPPYDPIGMPWANGRRCTDFEDPGPEIIPDVLWADGTPIHGPYDPHEWRAAVDAHGLPATRGGVTIGNHPKKEN